MMEAIAPSQPARLAERALRLAVVDPRDQRLGLGLGVASRRDREIVRWVGRLGAATVDQVRERFDLGRTVAYRRVAACIEGGLLDRVYLLHGEPALLRATPRGLRYADLALPVARLGPELAGHWLACGWAAVRLSAGEEAELLSEREIRAAERLERRTLASASVGQRPDGSPQLHRPDLVLLGAGEVVAIEVELTPKAPVRLEGIVRAWGRARCVDLVRYYAAPGTTMRGLERAIERAHARERVELRPLEEIL